MNEFAIGKPVKRREDKRYLTGTGRFIDDVMPDGVAHAYVLRSPHAHASVRSVATETAAAMPGVVAIVTAADLDAAGIKDIPIPVTLQNRDGSDMAKPLRPVLARDRVRYVGDPVALVVAETIEQAIDAADAVEVDYEPRASVTDPTEALAEGAPQLWDEAPGNFCVDYWAGDEEDAVDAIFERAAHVVALDLTNNRIAPSAMETRGAIGEYLAEAGTYVLRGAIGAVHPIRDALAAEIFGVPADHIRVISEDVGGGFGPKNQVYPELVLVLFAARLTGRPVKWISSRGEAFLTDHHSRDQKTRVELALDGEGTFLAYRALTDANVGAQLSTSGPMTPTILTARTLGGAYRIPALYTRVRTAFTNCTPLASYRGAGRPEACYQIERIVDLAAAELGIDPVELRRRNLIRHRDLPYRNRVGHEIDSGDLERVLELALEAADWPGFQARAETSLAKGLRRGIGVCLHQQCTGGGPVDHASLAFERGGAVTLSVGTLSHGQGHETVYPQIVGEMLGVPYDKVAVRFGDTTFTPTGGGYGGSRSMESGGVATVRAIGEAVEKGKEIAGRLLEAAAADIEFHAGRFIVAGTDRAVDIGAVIEESFPDGGDGGNASSLDSGVTHERNGVTYPNGCHIAEVEVDPETGTIDITAYVGVDDFGRILNPVTADGQIVGGAVQGFGQALLEEIIYDESGQLLTGSYMDYGVPRARHAPSDFRISFFEDAPTKKNPLGVKGAGESGTVTSPPAIVNAVVHALTEFGVRHIDMPLTAERVWRAIGASRS